MLMENKRYFVMMLIMMMIRLLDFDLETESMQKRHNLPCVPGESNNNGFTRGCA